MRELVIDNQTERVYTWNHEMLAGKQLFAESQRVFYCPSYHLSTQSDGAEVQVKNGDPVGDAIIASRLPLHHPIAFFALGEK